MANPVTTTLDTSNLTACLQELARMTGKDYRDIVRSEGQKILEKALSNATAASVESINKTKNPTLRAQKLAARGLQKKVFAQIGAKLNMQLTGVPAYVDRAAAPGGDYPEDASGTERTAGSLFSIDCRSDRFYDPTVFSALARAVNGRASYFKMNLRNGVFDKVDSIARKYPGLSVIRG